MMKVSEIQAAVIIVFLKVISVDADNKAYAKDLEFEYFDKWRDWEFARRICQGRSGDLVMIKSALIAEAISKLSRSYTSWIGASNRTNEGTWVWVDGTPVINSTNNYNWAENEPDGRSESNPRDEDCAAINRAGRWADVKCEGSKKHFICQKNRSTTETFGNHVFIYNRTSEVTYNEAKQACENINSRLVEIHQEDVDEAVREHIKTEISMYCGGKDTIGNKTVTWASGKNSAYHNWLVGLPSTQIEQCIVVKTDGWKDVNCTSRSYFICEMIYVSNLTISPKQVTLKDENGNVQVTCKAEGIPFPLVTWKGISESHRFTQRRQTGKSILEVSNATIADEGTYTCNAQNIVNGNGKSIKEELFLKVIAIPKDVRVNPVPCSSSLRVTWQANERALNAQHEITIFDSNGNRLNNYQAAASKATTQHTFTNLTSWTIHEIRVTPCVNSNCKYSYTKTSSATSHGKPGTVVGLTFLKSGQYSCSASWNHPTAVQMGYITGFVITVQETLNVVAPELNPMNTISTSEFQKTEKTFNLTGNPNRIYRVGVQARTCAGLGKIQWSDNSCVTEAKEPDEVKKAILSNSQIDTEGTIGIQVTVPEQDNGLISCLYVIVNAEAQESRKDLGLQYTLNELIEANKSLSNKIPKEYIAAAYSLSSMSSKILYLELGNGHVTECDANKEATNTKVMTAPNVRFVGQNLKMRQKTRYRIFIVTATPTSSQILLQSSSSTLIGLEETQNGALVVIVGVLLALACTILLVVGIILWKRKKNANGVMSDERCFESSSRQQQRRNSLADRPIDKDSSNYCTIGDGNRYEASTIFPYSDQYEMCVKAPQDSNQYESIDQVTKNTLQSHSSFPESPHYENYPKGTQDNNQYEQIDTVTEFSGLDGPYDL